MWLARHARTVIHQIRQAAVAACFAAIASACTLESSQSEPASQTSSQGLLGICAPLTCCFPSGGGWADNPFEDRLRSLGCTTPRAYTQSYGTPDWWVYSSCPASLDLTTLVLQYATVSPYYSQLVVNECLLLDGIVGGSPTDVFVQWDPTCETCRWRQRQ
jgi:hypothetical protein